LKNSTNLLISAAKPAWIASPRNRKSVTGFINPDERYFSRNDVSTPWQSHKNKVMNWKRLVVNFERGKEPTSKASDTKYIVLYRGSHLLVWDCILLIVNSEFLKALPGCQLW